MGGTEKKFLPLYSENLPSMSAGKNYFKPSNVIGEYLPIFPG
jgi:hypothetical protein